MAERIDLPMTPAGTEQEQLQQIFSYLYRTAQILNANMENAGSENVALTDSERMLFNQFTAANNAAADQVYTPAFNYAEAETLKSLIIKTAQFVKNEVDNYRLTLFGEESADSSFGNWKRKKGLRVDVTPDGVKQTYSYAEIIKGLKTYEINAKNYIKTGYLHDDANNLPVYGVAIGEDVVTFAEDGTETYNDGNKVAELTADELSFYQNETKLASYTGNKISFYCGGQEVFYIEYDAEQNTRKICCVTDMEIMSGGLFKISAGSVFIVDSANLQIDETGLTVIGGTIKSNLYLMDGSQPLSKDDIVVSTTQPEAAEGRIWIKPLDNAETLNYQQRITARTKIDTYSGTLTAAGTVSDPGASGYKYRLKFPVHTTGHGTGSVTVTVRIGSLTFTQSINHGNNPSGSGYDRVFDQTETSNTWIGTSSTLSISASVSGVSSALFFFDIGNIELTASYAGTGGAGWKSCEIKVYQA